MAFISQRQINGLAGWATTTCNIVVLAWTNAAATVTCNGTPYAVTFAQVGADRGSAAPDGLTYVGYVGVVNVTGLSLGTQYSYTITQGSNSVTKRFRTNLADASQDFRQFFISCDNKLLGATADDYAWAYIASYIQSGTLPVQGVVHSDDLMGYIDTANIDDTAGTGKKSTGSPSTTLKQYDYFLAFFNGLGMCGDTSQTAIAWGRGANRHSVLDNANYLPQHGNHEFGASYGTFSVNVAGSFPNAFHTTNPATAGFDGPGYVAWDTILRPLQPDSIATLDASANHWACTVGALRIVAPDNITRATATVAYGANQIADCLDAGLNTDDVFKALVMQHGPRYLVDSEGAHYPLFDLALTEFQRLVTDDTSTPQSLMLNPKTNGTKGVCIGIHTDHHMRLSRRLQAAAYASNLAEMIWWFNTGSVTGSLAHPVDTAIVAGAELADMYVKYTGPQVANDLTSSIGCLAIDVYGSYRIKEMHVHQIDDFNTVAATTRFIQNYGNDEIPLTWGWPQMTQAVDVTE